MTGSRTKLKLFDDGAIKQQKGNYSATHIQDFFVLSLLFILEENITILPLHITIFRADLSLLLIEISLHMAGLLDLDISATQK